MVLQNVISSYVQQGYEVIILGDFNDYDGEVPDINGNKPTSRVLDILKGNEGDFAAKQYLLYSVSETIAKEERYSDWWDSDNNCKTSSKKDFSVIDHILVTKNIRDHITGAFMYHGYQEYCGKYDSDHFPVVVDFEW
jgi:exonuclease III